MSIALSAIAIGDDDKAKASEQPREKQQEMPMGPPQQVKDAAGMIGTWGFKGEMRMTPEAPWEPFEATADFSYVCGGAAIQMDWRMPSPMGEMIGYSIAAYDRENNEWQETWVDNWSARIIMMTGTEKNGKRVMTGESIDKGQIYHMRNTSWDMAENSFKWQMEVSMDGENWFISMKGEYTKQ
jgi:hypothetical protein